MPDIRIDRATLRILRLMASGPVTVRRSGAGICKSARIGAGSAYPALYRLEAAGWLDSAWAPMPWPRPRVYWLTDYGRGQIAARFGELAPLPPPLRVRLTVWLAERGLVRLAWMAAKPAP